MGSNPARYAFSIAGFEVLKEHELTRTEGNRRKLPSGVRFQRKHVNSLWHIDDSEFGKKGKMIAVIDDCSRYCLEQV
ncbi:MAG: hypothetical protein QT08_C0017G0013 [archaeon GW2011_AR17]|nr:MAG: hypothetical protein QT08_C0017G0013 [archaeon GW2011_AR17]MBS3154394.1 hypothetical protein [Candidatus Woesearchaeota archaeon]HIH15064.1 hypothetical protein [Nanoarchaeota archaeon]HIH58657.1 hypothetical protein [Nanoarchaeota archaeon]HII14577.1 hypothetical protein [Nanoarchaeota archaeon]